MSKVVSFVTRQTTRKLVSRCATLNIVFADKFHEQICDEDLSDQKRKRVVKYFTKRTPEKLLSNIQSKGYSRRAALSTLFSQRFGMYLAIYRFIMKKGLVTLVLLELIKLIAEHLLAVATRFTYIAEGGETMFYNSFEVYSCDPVLCVDPIER